MRLGEGFAVEGKGGVFRGRAAGGWDGGEKEGADGQFGAICYFPGLVS